MAAISTRTSAGPAPAPAPEVSPLLPPVVQHPPAQQQDYGGGDRQGEPVGSCGDGGALQEPAQPAQQLAHTGSGCDGGPLQGPNQMDQPADLANAIQIMADAKYNIDTFNATISGLVQHLAATGDKAAELFFHLPDDMGKSDDKAKSEPERDNTYQGCRYDSTRTIQERKPAGNAQTKLAIHGVHDSYPLIL